MVYKVLATYITTKINGDHTETLSEFSIVKDMTSEKTIMIQYKAKCIDNVERSFIVSISEFELNFKINISDLMHISKQIIY